MVSKLASILVFASLLLGARLATGQTHRVIHEFIDDEILPQNQDEMPPADGVPTLSVSRRGSEAILGPDGFVTDTNGPFMEGPHVPSGAERALDEQTKRVERLGYHAVFEPHVAPFKRLVASEDVRKTQDGRYVVANKGSRKVSVSLQDSSAGERFWGSFLLRLEPTRWQPIASVAPKQRIVQIHTEPRVSVEIAKDAADNYYVRGDHRGILRLNMEVVVPTFFFSGKIPGLQWSDFAPIPDRDASIDVTVTSVLPEMMLSRTTPPKESLLRLVEFFRNFRPGTFPGMDGANADLYVTLVRERLGVCRHRSIAFVITARSLGIRARLVTNEAHAFVEVFWPGSGWRRIDLGGASDEMDLTLGTSGRAHEPGSDGMPEPPGFMEEMSRGMGDSASGAENISSDGAEPDGSGDNTDEGGETVSGEHDGLPSTPSDPNLSAAPESDAVASRGQRLLRQAVILRFRAEQESAIRGQTLVCEVSLLEADDRPIVGKKVSVFIAAVGVARPERGTKICEGLTDENGRFRQSCPIPATQEMGRWNVFGYFAGDEERTDAVAE